MLDLNAGFFPTKRVGASGSFRALQAELLPNSDERVTIAVVARFGDRWRAVSVPGLELLECAIGQTALLFKQTADDFVNYIETVNGASQLPDHTSLKLPISTLTWSSWTRNIEGSDWQDVSNVALAQSSLLAAIRHVEDRANRQQAALPASDPASITTKVVNLTKARLLKEVAGSLEYQAPDLSRYLRVNRPKAPLDSPDFIGSRTAAEFSVLRAKSIKGDLPEVQASLWRLDAFSGGQRSAIAFVKTDEQNESTDYGQLLERVTNQATARHLKLVAVTDIDRITSDLISMEHAAA